MSTIKTRETNHFQVIMQALDHVELTSTEAKQIIDKTYMAVKMKSPFLHIGPGMQAVVVKGAVAVKPVEIYRYTIKDGHISRTYVGLSTGREVLVCESEHV